MITKNLFGRMEIESASGGASSLLGLTKGSWADVSMALSSTGYSVGGQTISPFSGGSGSVNAVVKMKRYSLASGGVASAFIKTFLAKKQAEFSRSFSAVSGYVQDVYEDKDMRVETVLRMLSPMAGHQEGADVLQVTSTLRPRGATSLIAGEIVISGVFMQLSSVDSGSAPVDVVTSSPTDPSPSVAWRALSGKSTFSLSSAERTTPVAAFLRSGDVAFSASVSYNSRVGAPVGVINAQVPFGRARLVVLYGSGATDIYDLVDALQSWDEVPGIRLDAPIPAQPDPVKPPVVVVTDPAGKYIMSESEARAKLAAKPAGYWVTDKNGKRAGPTDKMAIECYRMYGERITHFGGGLVGAGPRDDVLWKPESDNDGNLVITLPFGSIFSGVRVGGETVTRFSMGNGWGPTLRFSKPGSKYPGYVEFLGTDDFLRVPNPSDRYSVKMVIAPPPNGNPVPPAPPDVPNDDKGVFKLLMLTDVAQDKNLGLRAGALRDLAKSYGFFLFLDLQYAIAGGKTSRVRPYVGPGRDIDKATGLLLDNLAELHGMARQVVYCPLSGWGAINDYGTQMGSVKRRVKEADLYTSAQLDIEMRFVESLLSRFNVQGIMPTLEGQSVLAVNWTKQYAARLRSIGYKGSIMSNLIGAASSRHAELRDHGVLLAPSINKASDWGKNGADVWNTDGMVEFTQDRTDLIERFTDRFGPAGYNLWISQMTGYEGGRPTYSPNLLKFCKRPLAPATPVPPPVVVPDVDDEPVIVLPSKEIARVGVWQETGTPARYGLTGRILMCSRNVKVSGCLNAYIVHPLYSPLKDAGPWSGPKARGVVQAQINAAKAGGWDAVAVDAEGILWTEAALIEVAKMIKAAGLLAVMVPKATFDPGGRRIASDWAGNARISNHYDVVVLWSYGSHTVHLNSRNSLISAGCKVPVGCLHDTFRNQANGYVGAIEGPKLASSCASGGILFVTFQPHYNSEATNTRIAAMFNGLKPSDPVTPVPPVDPAFTSLFYTTDDSITLRKDFAACVGYVVAYTQVNDPNLPGNNGPKGTAVVIQPTRSGYTWKIPNGLSTYPRGNVVNTWVLKIVAPPPAGVTYHTSVMQCFVRVGDNPFGPGSKTYPPTIRR